MHTAPLSPLSLSSSRSPIEPKGQAGHRICQRMAQVVATAAALHALAQAGVKHGGHALCAATTILAGLSHIYNGEFLVGGVLTAAGAREAYKILDSTKTDVQRLLQDASAGIDMIKTLEQANQTSFEHVEGNLAIVSQNMQDLEQRLKDIEGIATRGSQKLEKQKLATLGLYQEANALFKQTQQKLAQSQQQISTATQQFSRALEQIDQLVTLAKDEKGDFKEKAQKFSELSEQIHRECTQAKATLEEGNQALNAGLGLLNQALTKSRSASYKAGETTEMAKAKLEKIKKRASTEQNYQVEIRAIKDELQTVKARNRDILAIADEAQADVNKAEKKAETQFGLESLILGGGGGAFLGAVVSGGSAAGAGAVAGTIAYHNRKPIGNLLFGKDPEPVPNQPTESEPLTYKFNEKSTGWWGRYVEKRGSVTIGKFALNLGGNQVMNLNFDMNAKHKVSATDRKQLHKVLSQKLKDDPNFAPTCLKILKQMETISIDRGPRYQAVKGLIASNDPYFAELKRKATKKVISLS